MLLNDVWHKTKEILAVNWLKLFPHLTIIAVTGSVGKTTTKEAIAQVLSEKYRVVKSEANIDPLFNIPQTILKLRPGVQKLILEMGVEYPGEMDKYLSWVKPQIGVITQIAWTHTEFFGDIQGVACEKGKLLEALPANGWQVLNWDNQETRKLAKNSKAQVFFYGMNPNTCNLIAEEIKKNKSGVSFSLRYTSRHPELVSRSRTMLKQVQHDKITVNFPLLGEHNIYCALAAASLGIISGMTLAEIKRGLEKLAAQPSRLNILPGPKESTIIDDSYNASPAGVLAALKVLSDYPGHKKIAVLGEMKELGDYTKKGHQQVGEALVVNKIDYLIVFGQLTKDILGTAMEKGMDESHLFEARTMKEITMILKKLLEKDDVVLLKGSRFSHMERVILGLQGLEISCDLTACREYSPCALCKKLK